MSLRPVKQILQTTPTIEGAGVKLQRAFGFGKTKEFDPFLLLDDFRNDVPEDYLKGFPWHPHRGIETITYVLAGTVEHGDSIGNHGAITPGDVQWMTAGRGIIHQEMPKGDAAGRMHGFQLWANLPSALKMTDPRYQEVKSGDIPQITDDDGTHVRVICGNFWARAARWMGSPRNLFISMSPWHRDAAKHCQWERRGMRLRMCLPARENSATRPILWPCLLNRSDGSTLRRPRKRTIVRWCCSIAAMKLWCKQARKGSDSCWSRESRWRSQWRGMDRSS